MEKTIQVECIEASSGSDLIKGAIYTAIDKGDKDLIWIVAEKVKGNWYRSRFREVNDPTKNILKVTW